MLFIINAIKATEDFVKLMREGEEIINSGLIRSNISVGKKNKKKMPRALFIRIFQNLINTKMFQAKVA